MSIDIHGRLTVLDFVVIGIYILSVLSLGFWVSFRKKHTDDLFLAGRTLGWPNIGLSIWGTNISPSAILGFCSVGYAVGMATANFSWLAWIFLFLLAMVFVPHYLNTKISTMPEFISRRYNNSCRNFLSWYIVFSTVVMWIGGMLYAGGIMLGQIMQWPFWLSVLFLAVIATSFTVAGGLAAVVITDSFQSILMIAASAAITIIAFVKVGSIDKIISSVPPDYWQLYRPMDDPTYPWHAIFLGYPVMGIWFWCTDQTVVQRVLGARNIEQGQLGAIFAAFIKVLDIVIFLLPGILCRVLHPGLVDSDEAYITMVTNYLPIGMIGLVVAVLLSALISTVDSGLNSLSTVLTLDIYCKHYRPNATTKERIWLGRVATVVAAVLGIIIALGFNAVKGMDLFSLGQSVVSFLAPSMAAVFLIGVLWKRATSSAALLTLIIGNIISVGVGILYLAHWPSEEFWPHFLLLSFYLFVALSAFMIIVSLFTEKPSPENALPSLIENIKGNSTRRVWILWGVVCAVMLTLYIVFA